MVRAFFYESKLVKTWNSFESEKIENSRGSDNYQLNEFIANNHPSVSDINEVVNDKVDRIINAINFFKNKEEAKKEIGKQIYKPVLRLWMCDRPEGEDWSTKHFYKYTPEKAPHWFKNIDDICQSILFGFNSGTKSMQTQNDECSPRNMDRIGFNRDYQNDLKLWNGRSQTSHFLMEKGFNSKNHRCSLGTKMDLEWYG